MENISNQNSSKKWIILGIIVLILFVGVCSTRVFFFTFVDSHEVGYKFNKVTGQITVLDTSGWHHVVPLVTEVNAIDLRPMQVRIESNDRVLNAMLVQFNKEGVTQFVNMHGRKDYDASALKPILMSYAYEGIGSCLQDKESLQKKYKFLKILGSTNPVSLNSVTETAQDTLK